MLKYLLLLCFISAICAQQGLVSNIFGSNMVLQRAPEAATIFGWVQSTALETISIYLNDVVVTQVVSNPNREWLANLPPQPAGGPFKITVASTASGSVTLEDVYFGDVFVCSGQSNMQFTVNEAFNASEEIRKADMYPMIRVFTVGQATTSDVPLQELRTITQRWSVGSSASVGGPSYQYFSALCWFTAVRLYDQYKIPLGLISSNWGGTYIQAWSSPDALKKCGAADHSTALANTKQKNHPMKKLLNFADQKEDQGRTVAPKQDPSLKVWKPLNQIALEKNANITLSDPNQPSVLYNAMIYPLRLVRVRGALWYQGESNVGNAPYYACAQTAMIQDWVALFNLKNIQFTFYFIQLSPWESGPGDAIPDLRQSQLGSLQLPYVGFATAADLGDIDAPTGSIHPRDKQTLGLRLALQARVITYGEQGLVYQGPMALNWRTIQQAGTKVIVEVNFAPTTLGSGLELRPAECPEKLRNNPGVCGWYELQRSGDGVWVNATQQEVTLDSRQLHIAADNWDASRTVEAVRYGYATWPVCTLYNKEGLPAIPFSLKKSVV